MPILTIFILVVCIPLASQLQASEATQRLSITDLAKHGRLTLARLETSPVSWTAVHQVSGAHEIHVTIAQHGQRQRIEMHNVVGEHRNKFLQIIQRDGLWYVQLPGKRQMYRPQRAPLPNPALYVFLIRSEPLIVSTDDASSLGELLDIRHGVAKYRTPLAEPLIQQLESNAKDLEKAISFSKERGDERLISLQETLAKVREALKGHITQIDVETGVIVGQGGVDRRVSIRDFKFHDKLEDDTFDIGTEPYADHSSSLLDGDLRRLALFSHASAWRPHGPKLDTGLVMLHLDTGEIRRIPFPLGIAAGGCFTADRKSVVVAGHVTNEGTLRPYKISLETGAGVPLGGDTLARGFTLFPKLSPDGKHVVVQHRGSTGSVLQSRIQVINLETNEVKPVGGLMDMAFVSGLPDGDGFIILHREYESLDQPAREMICRVDLDGKRTEIREGKMPLVIPSIRKILFRDKSNAGDVWKLCDLNGENAKLVGKDGFPKSVFPTAAPDGKQIIIIKYGGEEGPRPHIVDLETGSSKAVPVADGLWTMPSW